MLPHKLFSEHLIDEFGPDSHIFPSSIPCIYDCLLNDPEMDEFRDKWADIYGEIYGMNSRDINNHLLGLEYSGLKDVQKHPDLYLYSLQTYYYLILNSLAQSIPGIPSLSNQDTEGLEVFTWPFRTNKTEIQEIIEKIRKKTDEVAKNLNNSQYTETDHLGPLYQAVIARKIRHSLGEYYTPARLADLCLEKTGYNADPDGGLLDPSCGSGIFLVRAISLAKENDREGKTELLNRLSDSIHGFDINPLAVLSTRLNCLLAVRDISGKDIPKRDLFPNIKVYDPIAGNNENIKTYKYVVGNPPWMRWLDIPVNYRETIKPLWKKYGLFTQKGLNSRMGSAELDFSLLFTYICTDKFLSRDNGKLGFFITRECVTSKKAGAGFRRFELAESKEKISVREFHDFSEVSPFEAANKTSLLIMELGAATMYPVKYIRWSRNKKKPATDNSLTAEENLVREILAARPVSGTDGPWQVFRESELVIIEKLRGHSAYKARRGADIEPYGVYFLEVLSGDGKNVLIRNMPELGKKKIEKIEPVEIETEFVYPVIRGRDIGKWMVSPAYSVILPNKSLRKDDIPAADYLRENYPLTHSYLLRFKKPLLNRKSSIIKNLIDDEQFYTVFGVGDYTFSGLKVIWQRMSDKIKAVVVNDPAGAKPHIPAASTSFVSFPDGDEETAHYVCALLNSAPALFFFKTFSPPGRGFGTPSLLEKINIPELKNTGETGRKMAELSKHCHHQAAQGNMEEVTDLENELNTVACDIWDLTNEELEKIR